MNKEQIRELVSMTLEDCKGEDQILECLRVLGLSLVDDWKVTNKGPDITGHQYYIYQLLTATMNLYKQQKEAA